MILRRFALALLPALLLPTPLAAQQASQPAPVAAPVPPASGWKTGSDIPLDPAFITGTLPNGVRYAVRRNGEPTGRLSIRVHLRVGALMEEDSEQGWAHLTEHMLFRGTKHFPDGEGEKAWQRLGARPGSHSNAFTSQSSTRYVLDISRADTDAVNQALTILADMMAHATLDKTLLEKEQKIVLAERAMRFSASEERIQIQRSRFYQPGHRAGERNIVGTPETLAAADAKTLRKFYHRWYRPERTTVVIVGDADPAMLITAISKAFGGWRGEGKSGAEVPQAPVPQTPTAATIIEPHYSDSWEMIWQSPPEVGAATVKRREQDVIDTVALMVLNNRLSEEIERSTDVVRATASTPRQTPLVPRRLSLLVQMAADSKPEEAGSALDRVYRIVNGAQQAVQPEEVHEQLRNLARSYREAVEREARAQSPIIADAMVATFDPQTIFSQPTYNQAMLERLQPSITAGLISERLRALFGGRPRILYISAKEPRDGIAGLDAAVTRAMAQQPPAAIATAQASLDALVLAKPTAKLVSQSQIADLGITRARLSNDVEIALRPNDQLKNQISIRVRFGRGVVGRAPGDAGLYWSIRSLGLAGIGPFDRVALQRIGAGRQIVPQYMNDMDGAIISVTTTREDMADAMKLMVGALTQMRYDDVATRRFQAALKTGYRNFLSDPSSVMEITGSPLRYGGDARFRPLPSLMTINQFSPEAFKRFWTDELASGPVKVTIVGDFDPAKTLPTAIDMFSRLSPQKTPEPDDRRKGVVAGAEKGKSRFTLYHIGDPDRAMSMLVYPTISGAEDLKSARAVQLTTFIVKQRLAEGFRAQQGGTYLANATSYTNRALPKFGAMMVSSELKPELIPRFEAAVREVMTDLATNGPSADSFARARTPMLAELETIRKSNAYWTQLLGDDLDAGWVIDGARTYISGRAALTPADVQQVAKNWLAGENGQLPPKAFVIEVLPAPKQMPRPTPTTNEPPEKPQPSGPPPVPSKR